MSYSGILFKEFNKKYSFLDGWSLELMYGGDCIISWSHVNHDNFDIRATPNWSGDNTTDAFIYFEDGTSYFLGDINTGEFTNLQHYISEMAFIIDNFDLSDPNKYRSDDAYKLFRS